MKFIRTKDTIFEVVDENEKVYLVKAKGNPHNVYAKSKNQTKIIDESDNLEDVINRYVKIQGLSYKIYTRLQFGKLERKEVKRMLEKGARIYGAVWTATGLKYVAKLNTEGELELL